MNAKERSEERVSNRIIISFALEKVFFCKEQGKREKKRGSQKQDKESSRKRQPFKLMKKTGVKGRKGIPAETRITSCCCLVYEREIYCEREDDEGSHSQRT